MSATQVVRQRLRVREPASRTFDHRLFLQLADASSRLLASLPPSSRLRQAFDPAEALEAVGRQAALSVERDDDLAVGAALLYVRQRLEGLVERERPVDERAEVAGVVEGGKLAQLPAVGLHEQERVGQA
jgi:hypothetical protein